MWENQIQKEKYKMGKGFRSWRDEQAQTLTFMVTEDCNLRCKHCYITHKNSGKVMDFNVAKQFIEYVFTIKSEE